LQLAVDVADLDQAVEFYSQLFDTKPVKIKPGYANFSVSDPPLKLVLFENEERGGTINHLGVEAETMSEVVAAEVRLTGSDLDTTGVQDVECCYAAKTETWVDGPNGIRWEWYVKYSDTEQTETVGIEIGDWSYNR